MILCMPSTVRPQQRYDHRLRDLVYRSGDVTLATDLSVPRSTARGWLGGPATVVVSLHVAAGTDMAVVSNNSARHFRPLDYAAR